MLQGKTKKRKRNENGFEKWGGYMNAKITKLEAQFDEEEKFIAGKDEKVSDIFKGVAIFVNGYTEPSADELRCIMLQHGGIYHHYYRTGKTTHIIASALPNAKFDQMKHLKVVKCEWITESVKAGRLLDYKKFLLLNDFPNAAKSENLLLKYAKKEAPAQKNEPDVPKTAADVGYLTEFYNNSRLHYISALAAMLKQYVQDMREKHNGIFPSRQILLEDHYIDHDITEEKVIIHIDMDCFFVSVALRNHPELKGQPVAVTHSRGRGSSNRQNVDRKFESDFYKKKMQPKIQSSDKSSDEESREKWAKEKSSMSEIASCSYEARKAGVAKGMYLGVALKLCPDLKTVPYDFEGYKEVSMTLYNTVAEFTLDIEAISCDELFIDCTSLIAELKVNPMKFVEVLRTKIFEKTKCTASAGIGSNKLQARLATKHAKPNGQFYLTPDKVDEFMKELPIKELPGVGRTISYKLRTLKIKTCQDMQELTLKTLQKEFGGKTGQNLYNNCRGIDDRKVNFLHERKSVSAEINYGIRFNDDEETETFLKQLSEEVSKRLSDIKMMGKNITFKVMFRAKDAPVETAKFLGHGACDLINRSVAMPVASNDSAVIAKHVIDMYHQLGIPANELRGLGIQITKLEPLSSKNSNTLQTYFAAEQTKEKEPATKKLIPVATNIKAPTASQIDPEVLASLPPEIRDEVLKEYGLAEEIKPEEKIATTEQLYDALFEDEEAQIIFNLGIKDLRFMIKEWVSAEHSPKTFDVSVLNSYLRKLVKRKSLENVSVIIKCLKRYINKKRRHNKVWKKAYTNIIESLQSAMLSVFGKTLAIEYL